MGLFSLIPLWGRLLAVAALVAALYGGYRVWRHEVWQQGVTAALDAVKKENGIAATAANKVGLTVDQCYDAGGEWNVETASCDR